MKHKLQDRLLALVLSLVMAFSLTAAAFATEGDTSEGGNQTNTLSTEEEATTEEPTTAEPSSDEDETDTGSGNGSEGGSEAPTGDGENKDPASVSITTEKGSDDDQTLKTGDTLQFKAFTGAEAFSWKSSDEKVVTIDANGLATAVGPGEASITAVIDNGTEDTADDIKSNAVDITVSGVTLSKDSLELLAGRSETLSYSRFGEAVDYSPVWSSSNISVADFKDARVITYNPGTVTVTVTCGKFTATCTVTVKEDVAAVINKELAMGKTLSFADLLTGKDSLSNRAQTQMGTALEYVSNLSVSPRQGILYYQYSSPDLPGSGVGSKERYYVSAGATERAIADVTFVPAAGFSGEAEITYSGFGGGKTFSGTILVNVENASDVTYNTAKDRPLPLAAEDFNAVCLTRTTRTLRYITFQQPAASRGTLYHNYSEIGQYSQKVGADEQYYADGGNRLLEDVTFVPAEGFTGTVVIPYVGTDSSGYTYVGQVTITVYSVDGSGEGDIIYYASAGNAVGFDAEDFNDVCRRKTSSTLDYVYFTLPEAAKGVLYHNGAAASATVRYFRSGDPSISELEFVPAEGFSGTAEIRFTGYTRGGDTFEGIVAVRASGSEDTIRYEAAEGQKVYFDGLDFNEACMENNGSGLNYIRFTPPDGTKGTLYYGSAGREARTTDRFTKSSLSDVYFVPAGGFHGSVSIPFSGYDEAGGVYGGAVEIVIKSGSSISGIHYSGSVLPVKFNAEDFRTASALPSPLATIRFNSLPSSAYGRLLLNYQVGVGYELVQAGTDYYSGGTVSVNNICFLPKAGFQGTVTIPYTAVDTAGNSVEGTVRISISNSYLTRSFKDTGNHTWAESSIEFLRESGVIQGDGKGSYMPAGSLSRGDYTLMLYRLFNFSPRTGSGYADVPTSSYYAEAIVTAKALGIISAGQSDFQPTAPVTRQEAVAMLLRAMEAAGQAIPASTVDSLNAYGDGGQVAGYAREAMAAMVTMGIIGGDEKGNLSPEKNLTRAEIAVILHRMMTM